MKSPIKRYPHDVRDWWQKVQDDIKWANHNLSGKFYTQTCFVTQQIAEKALKTYLLDNNKIVSKIHKLPLLLSDCIKINKSFRKFIKHAKILDRFYITTRYPFGFGGIAGEYTQKEAREALDLAIEIVDHIKFNT